MKKWFYFSNGFLIFLELIHFLSSCHFFITALVNIVLLHFWVFDSWTQEFWPKIYWIEPQVNYPQAPLSSGDKLMKKVVFCLSKMTGCAFKILSFLEPNRDPRSPYLGVIDYCEIDYSDIDGTPCSNLNCDTDLGVDKNSRSADRIRYDQVQFRRKIMLFTISIIFISVGLLLFLNWPKLYLILTLPAYHFLTLSSILLIAAALYWDPSSRKNWYDANGDVDTMIRAFANGQRGILYFLVITSWILAIEIITLFFCQTAKINPFFYVGFYRDYFFLFNLKSRFSPN